MEWKQLEEHSNYSVSDAGLIRNDITGRLRKPDIHHKGYYRVALNKKNYFIHRLVAKYYIPNPSNKPQVNHKNGIKTNNSKENLEWMSNTENFNHAILNNLIKLPFIKGAKHFGAKLTEEQAKIAKYSIKRPIELAKELGVKLITIYKIRQGKMWTHI